MREPQSLYKVRLYIDVMVVGTSPDNAVANLIDEDLKFGMEDSTRAIYKIDQPIILITKKEDLPELWNDTKAIPYGQFEELLPIGSFIPQ